MKRIGVGLFLAGGRFVACTTILGRDREAYDEIGFGEQAADRRILDAELLLLRFRQPVAIAVKHARAEAACHAGRERADFAEPDDAERFAK